MGAPAASEAQIRNAIEAAQKCGLTVGAVEVAKNGTVKIIAQSNVTPIASRNAPPRWGEAG